MNENYPIYEGTVASDTDSRLVDLFDEMDKHQIVFLDEANKRIVELTTLLLGILFVVTAFGDKYPPPYLEANSFNQVMAITTLGFYITAMLVGFMGVKPRQYKHFESNLSEMRKELRNIMDVKSRYFKIGSILFFLGSVGLTVMVGSVILSS